MAEGDVLVEFSRNFTALQVKYEEQAVRLHEALQRNKDQSIKMDALKKDVEQRDESLRTLKAELAEALQHKERAAKAAVSAEHLRGRVETFRKALEEKEMEHRHEVEQLRAQLNDAFSRVAANTDSQLVNAVRNQKIELEERCALMSSQLMEEKERSVQQQLAAVASVRDLASRNLELEQRCRALDTEVSQLRATARRSADQVAEVMHEKERVAMENSSLSTRLHAVTRDLASANARAEERLSALDAQLAERTADFSREREALLVQIADAQQRVNDMMALRAADADRTASHQRSSIAKLESSRAELETDLEQALKAKHAALEETQRVRAKLSQERVEAEDTRSQLRNAEARIHSLQVNINSLQARMDAVAQNEAWLAAERDRLSAVVEKSTKRAEELAHTVQVAEARSLDVERLTIQLDAARRDIVDAAASRERELAGFQRLEEAYQLQLHTAQREVKVLKKKFARELEREDRHKKILLKALLEKETTGDVASMLATRPTPATTEHPIDALSLLRAQGEAAKQFQMKMQELQHPGLVSAA